MWLDLIVLELSIIVSLEREKYWADIYTGTCLVVLELSIIVSLEREKYWADIYTGTCLVVLELSIIESWRERRILHIYIYWYIFDCSRTFYHSVFGEREVLGRYIYWYMFGCSRTFYHRVLERETHFADIYILVHI